MTTTLQRVDTDLTTVLLDLNAGGNGFELAHDPDMGTIAADNTFVSDIGPEMYVASTQRAPVDVTLRLVARHSSTDNLRTLVNSLATYLDLPGTYKFQMAGMSSPLYFDAFRGDIPNLIRGQEGSLRLVSQLLMDPDGLPVVLHRLPYLYGAKVTSAASAVVNDPSSGTNKRTLTISATGNMPTRANITIAPETGAKIVQARIARRSHGDVTSFTTNWFQRANGGPISGASANVADATATGANALNCSSGNADIFLRRRRWTVSPSPASGLEGTFRIYARLKCNGTGANTYHVQARWAGGNVDPAGFTNPRITLTYPGNQSAYYGMVDLGTCTVDSGLGVTYGLALEFWANRSSGSDALYLDYLCLMPTSGGVGDQMATVAVRGFRDDFGTGRTEWTGDELIRGSTFDNADTGTLGDGNPPGQGGQTYSLESVNDACGSPPAAGITLGAGRYVVFADLVITRPASNTNQTSGELVVEDMTTPAVGATIASRAIGFTHSGNRRSYRVQLTFDLAGSTPVLFYLVSAAANHTIKVKSISYYQQPGLGLGSELNLFGEYGVNAAAPMAYITQSGVYAQPLTQAGAFIDLSPGNNVLVFDWGDQPPDEADQIDDREPVAQSTLTRSCTVTVSYYPRFSG